MIAAARAQSADIPNIRFIQADLTDYDLGSGRYDFIACVAAVHHLPFQPAIAKLRHALTAGGVLAIIGCYRQATPADYAPDLAAVPANIAANMVAKAKARRHGITAVTQIDTAPIMQPRMTLPEIKREALRLLPGAAIRRRLYWRYSLIYRHQDTGFFRGR